MVRYAKMKSLEKGCCWAQQLGCTLRLLTGYFPCEKDLDNILLSCSTSM